MCTTSLAVPKCAMILRGKILSIGLTAGKHIWKNNKMRENWAWAIQDDDSSRNVRYSDLQ
jgi:hypothetical protein